jgi:hypothetical protein
MQIDTYKALKICSPLLSFMTIVLNIIFFQKDIILEKTSFHSIQSIFKI